MSPGAFARICHKLAPLIDARLSVESRDAIARIIADPDAEKVARADAISIAAELLLWCGAAKRR